MPSRFRFAILLAEASSKTEWVEKTRLAEQLGYDVVLLPDHVNDQLSPFPALVSAAEATQRVRLGTFVVDNDFRHPLLLAQEAATVNLLTEGRLELGIGAGWMGQDYRRMGIRFDPPSVRLQRLKEAVSIVSLYFRGEPFSFDGAHYQVKDALPKPMGPHRPPPPLLIGGGGRQILAFAAREANIVSMILRSLPDGSGFDLSELTAASYQQKADLVRRVARESGNAPELNVLIQYFQVTDNRRFVAENYARDLGIDADDILALPFALIGTIEQIVADLLQRRERFGISYVTVFEKYLRAFALVIEGLSGV